jgi:hypothetical protein
MLPRNRIINLSGSTLSDADEMVSSQNFLFLVDMTNSHSYISTITSLSQRHSSLYLSLESHESTFINRVEIHISPNSEFQALSSLLSTLKIDSYTILSSSSPKDSPLVDLFKSIKSSETFFYSDNITEAAAESLTLKLLKTRGVKNLIIIDSSPSLITIEKALKSKNWLKSGVLLIYSSKTFSKLDLLGTLKISEEGTQGSKSLSEYHYNAVLEFIQNLNIFSDRAPLKTREEVAETARNMKKTHFLQINLLNFQPEAKKVAIFEGADKNLTIFSKIIFPGNVSDPSSTSRSPIILSIANGTNDPYNSFTFTYLAYMFNGASHAVQRSNENNDLPNFELKLSPNDCGMFWYEPFWYTSCFSPLIPSFGIGFITSFFGDAIKGNLLTLRSLNKLVPQVSPLGTDDSLDNKTAFPELVKLESKQDIYIACRLQTLLGLGFRDIVLIGSNESAGVSSYEFYKKLIEETGLRIANNEENRFINYYYKRENFTEYEKVFKEIRKTRCTVFAIVTHFKDMVLEALYDVGYRAGEIIYLTDSSSVNYLEGVQEPYLSKRIELTPGALIFSYREFVGTLGQIIKQELLEKYEELAYMCMTFDTVSVFKESINYLILIGEDFENYSKLMFSIRMNRFVGCLGKVFFDSGGNSRSSAQLLIQQIYYNSTEKKMKSVDVAYYDRFSQLTINMINEFQWQTGKIPPNFLPVSECGFEMKKVRNSEKGKEVLYYLTCGLFVVAIVSGALSVKFNNKRLEELTSKTVISLDDMMFYLFFPLEFFQILTIGPDQDAYKELIGNLQILVSMDLNQYFSFKYDKFWHLFQGVLSFCLFWIFLALVKITKIDLMLWFGIRSKFQEMMLNIFSCYRAVGSDLEDSYLHQDCRKHCYTGYHKKYAIVSSIVVYFFIFFGVYLRPLYQEMSTTLNLRTKVSFIVTQSILQVLLVILNKTLKIENQITHGIIMTLILLLYLFLTCILKPYNFRRPFIAHCGFISASVWAVAISTIFHDQGSLNIWAAVEFSGLGCILIVTFFLFKRSPEVLYSEKGRDISGLFIFQFCKDYERYVSDVRSIDFIKSGKYREADSSKLSS